MNFIAWAGCEAEHSPAFRGGVARLRRLAAGAGRSAYSKSTGVLTARSWAELAAMLAASVRRPQRERPRAWTKTELATDDGLRHLRGCRKLASI